MDSFKRVVDGCLHQMTSFRFKQYFIQKPMVLKLLKSKFYRLKSVTKQTKYISIKMEIMTKQIRLEREWVGMILGYIASEILVTGKFQGLSTELLGLGFKFS